MPELPEVETTCRGIRPYIIEQKVERLIVRQPRLRWPVPPGLPAQLRHKRIKQVSRRAKYLLVTLPSGTLIIHLGMSGSLRIIRNPTPPGPHDHIDMVLESGVRLRYTDPRRFGTWLWTDEAPERHPLLNSLGPEPLDDAFSGEYLYCRSRGRRLAVKSFLMDSHSVVGVGNIYANEALFLAGIHPARAAGRISRQRYDRLVAAVKEVLSRAIKKGGTTLRDFTHSEGRPGYFRQSLNVYGRGGEPCRNCGTALRETRTGQRSTVYCTRCQH